MSGGGGAGGLRAAVFPVAFANNKNFICKKTTLTRAEPLRLRRQANILAMLPDMIFVMDASTNVISFCNQRCHDVLGHESLIGEDFYSLLVPPSRPLIGRLLGDVCKEVTAVVTTSGSSESSATSRSPSEQLHADEVSFSECNFFECKLYLFVPSLSHPSRAHAATSRRPTSVEEI